MKIRKWRKTGSKLPSSSRELNTPNFCLQTFKLTEKSTRLDLNNDDNDNSGGDDHDYDGLCHDYHFACERKLSNKSQVYNSIVLASDDETVYLTVSSTRFVLSDGVFEVEFLVQTFVL